MNSVCPVVSFAHVLGMWMTRVYVFPLYRVVHYKQKTEKKKKRIIEKETKWWMFTVLIWIRKTCVSVCVCVRESDTDWVSELVSWSMYVVLCALGYNYNMQNVLFYSVRLQLEHLYSVFKCGSALEGIIIIMKLNLLNGNNNVMNETMLAVSTAIWLDIIAPLRSVVATHSHAHLSVVCDR